ncbi:MULTISPECIES: DNA polymerase III subunit beta [Cyanophyceae]|uniref:DNA polymerase III subunit beta n=1 Tax=Cyanophyceae TaxID=3028117 RepID=UPI00168222FD|nr:MULTISPECIES: DNA polymerase III subunit beta [Cyanophyceae]MBD1916837.1 DNA polymerase III subunit beta [Phormidium sp. FACHB-77]MBD2029468.1 DNA polymerase III subunit beta [Phormidium sp. FACHB-322]MBD2052044.1 DNA polymerase III subunit beta [Leptolyngbya sp. FACHB-60]
MKFICPQNELSAQLSSVSRAVSSRPSRPVLANILVKADIESQSVTLVGFDEVLGIESRFSAQVEEPGTLTLPSKLWGDIVSRLANEDITLESEGDSTTVTLTSSSGRYEVRGLSAEDYPSLPTVEDGEAISLSADALLSGLRGSLFATSSDETKQVLTGVHLLSATDALEFAATDGHRLSVVQTTDESATDTPVMDVTVPAKALRELERMIQGYTSNEPVALRLDETQVLFDLGAQRLTTRLLEGQYPNYRQLLPKQFARQVTVDRKGLMASLERIAVLASQKNDIIKITLNPGDQSIALSVEAQEVGSGHEELPAQVSGDELDIAFNVRYLLDGLKAFDTTEVQMQCNAATSPAVFVPLGETKITYLVMPVQIRG